MWQPGRVRGRHAVLCNYAERFFFSAFFPLYQPQRSRWGSSHRPVLSIADRPICVKMCPQAGREMEIYVAQLPFSPHIPRMCDRTTHVQPLSGQWIIPPERAHSNETERTSFSFQRLGDLGSCLSSQEPRNLKLISTATQTGFEWAQACTWTHGNVAKMWPEMYECCRQTKMRSVDWADPQTGTPLRSSDKCTCMEENKITVCEGKGCRVGKERSQLCLGGGSCLSAAGLTRLSCILEQPPGQTLRAEHKTRGQGWESSWDFHPLLSAWVPPLPACLRNRACHLQTIISHPMLWR